MGTRNLTVVIHKGEVRMAQYGQWDGYPGGVGRDIAKALSKYPINEIRSAIDKCSFIPSEEISKRYEAMKANPPVGQRPDEAFTAKYPLLSRDNSGGHALDIIMKNGGGEMFNDIKFAADSLFCEWAYVLDLDTETVEVYKGFNKSPLAQNERFYGLLAEEKIGKEYHPVRLLKSYNWADYTEDVLSELEKSEE